MSYYSKEECFYCGEKDLKKGHRMILEKRDAKPSIKNTAASCIPCTERQELELRMNELSFLSDIPIEKLKNYACIANSLRAFSENSPGSEKKEIVFGLIDRTTCIMCREFIELGHTYLMKNHILEHHSKDEIFFCNSGCNSYHRKCFTKIHKDHCGILCPVCKNKFAKHTGHFAHVHPCVTCTVVGCPTAFELKKNEHGEDESGTNEFLNHILTTHVWKINESAETD